jgi:hypothetical protein
MPEPKRVAAVVTEYRRWSHADVIVGKIIEGFNHDGKDRPRMRLASLYVDQRPKGDMSESLAKRHNFPIFRTIEGALTLGRKGLNVDGVLCIGEHGDYPVNARGQRLYPRRRFFEEAANVFRRAGRSVPVFNDKHLSVTWEDARWMYDCARALYAPFSYSSYSRPEWPDERKRKAPGAQHGAPGAVVGYWPDADQSSSGSMIVTTGSPSSPGPQRALSWTSGGVPPPLSLRTCRAKATTGPPSPRRIARASIQTISQSRPGSSWQATPGGTVTQRAQAAAVSATG